MLGIFFAYNRITVASILLALGFVCAGSRADAGCGEPILTLDSDAADTDASPMGNRPKAPCHGSNCSERPTAPPFLPQSAPTSTPQTKVEIASPVVAMIDVADPNSLHSIPDSLDRPVRRSSAPFHPPRSF